nr:transcription termination factor Rho [Klugiella xanthotipulae]
MVQAAAETEAAAAPAAENAPAAAAISATAPEVEAPAAPKKRATRTKKVVPAVDAPAESTVVAAPVEKTSAAPVETPTTTKAPAAATAAVEALVAEVAAAGSASSAVAEAPPATKKPVRTKRGRKTTPVAAPAESGDATGNEQSASASPVADTPVEAQTAGTSPDNAKRNDSRSRNNAPAESKDGDTADKEQGGAGGTERQSGRRNRNDRTSNRNDRNTNGGDRNTNERNNGPSEDEENPRGGRDVESRNSRNRQRDRKRRGGLSDELEPEITEDDVLLPIAGILDVLDNYAFVRTSGYLPGTNDVYVSLGQVKKYNLRKGDAVVGAIRQPRDGDHNGRQKYNAIVKIDSINGLSIEENENRVDFNALTPLYPQERLRLETSSEKLTQRIIDLVSPVGKGQRGLIVAPPKAGKTIVMQQIANAIAVNNPEVHLMVVLVDERPEEVTDMQRTVKGEVIASTFDRPAEDHTTVAELAIERAKRLVELGHDVVVLLDSITRLGRAYNLIAPASGRVLSGGVDASALYPPKRFFGAARNIENGGSLTILATALVETGSKMDEVIFEEFKGTGNMELRLSRQLADKRIFPAVDVTASSTRREEMLMGADEVKVTWKLRRALSGLDQQQAVEVVLGKLKETSSNVEFLMQMQKSGAISSVKD